MSKKCVNCGVELEDEALFCEECGTQQPTKEDKKKAPKTKAPKREKELTVEGNKKKSKTTAALLAFFLGSLGIHDFYLGYIPWGILKLVLTVFTCGVVGSIWAFVDFIRILVGSIKADAKGNPIV